MRKLKCVHHSGFDATSLKTSELDDCNGKFVLCYTCNGKIRMKRSARKQGLLTNGNKDEDTGNWVVILSPDDLFHHNIDVDVAKLNYKPMLINECNHYNAEGSGSSSKSEAKQTCG